MPPLEAVRVFEAVARRGSTVAAAAELGLTHGAVSRRIHALEERLGTVLLGRGRGGRLVPTETGEQFAAAARQALGLLAEAAAVASRDDTRRRAVRISTTSSIAALWLVPQPVRDLGYFLIARHRYAIFGKKETCRLPSPAERSRFLA
jgi:DNA-binding transcriptional LysR family regulator